MYLSAEFLIQIEHLKTLATNDNHAGDEDFIIRNLATSQLTYTLAMFERDEGAS